MDKIYEAYEEQVNEMTLLRYTVERAVRQDFDRVARNAAKEFGAKYFGTTFDKAAFAKFNAIKHGKRFADKVIGPGVFGINLVKDLNSDQIRFVAALGRTEHYNATQLYGSAKDYDSALKQIQKFLSGIKPVPSAKDVNDAAARHRSGRL